MKINYDAPLVVEDVLEISAILCLSDTEVEDLGRNDYVEDIWG